MQRLAARNVAALDPYRFTALIGQRGIHSGGRASIEALLSRAAIKQSPRVLDVGYGATRPADVSR